jgi:hypothetical protein
MERYRIVAEVGLSYVTFTVVECQKGFVLHPQVSTGSQTHAERGENNGQISLPILLLQILMYLVHKNGI